MAFGRKKKNEEDGLDVLEELKEPFSFSTFFEEQVVERFRKLKKFLEEKGILFFLLSPFQQRNRLILELALIVTGVMIGIVPRGASLIQDARERNAASELAALLEDEAQFTSGRIQIRPLMSSQYGKEHLLAFLISGSGDGVVPSTANRYSVHLNPARGVTDPEHVTYSYQVLPISEDQRLFLLHTDHTKQEDTTGIYNLTIQATADDLEPEEIPTIEIVLSNTQETTGLYGKDGVNLSVLSDAVLNSTDTPIADAQDALAVALDDYQMEVERIESLPGGLTPQPTFEELTEWADTQLVYPDLTDTSTTSDIEGLEEVEEIPSPVYAAGITYDGTLYQDEDLVRQMEEAKKQAEAEGDGEEAEAAVTPGDVSQVTEAEEAPEYTREEEDVLEQLTSLQSAVDDVIRAITDVNSACMNRYDMLDGLRFTLNQEVDVSGFPETGVVGTAG